MAMKLSAEMFNEIISSLRSDTSESHGHEKRTQGRVGLRCALEIVQFGLSAKGTKPTAVCVHDISLNGIGLVSPARLAEDTEFVARLSRDGHSPVPILYKVRYCRRLGNDLYNIGAMFQRVLPDAAGEVLALGRKSKHKKASPVKAKSEPDGVGA
jgi:hypothetical protein